MSSAKNIIVNCGASHVTYAVFGGKGQALTIDELHVAPLDYDYSEEDAWLSAVTAALRDILASAKTKGEATLIAPGYQLLTKTIKVPHVEPEKQSQIIAFEAQQNIPYPLGEVVWGHQIVADDGVEAEVVLIAFKSVAAIRFCNTIASLGLRPISVQAASVLDYNAFHCVYPQVQDTTLLINIGARSSSMLFVSSEGFFTRNIALGGNSLTQNIADQMGRNFIQAEQVKTSVFNGEVEYNEEDQDQMQVWQAAQGFIRRMGQEITRSVVNYRRAKKGQAPTLILLTGRGSLIPGLAEQLAESQQMAVDYFDPTQAMTPGAHVDPRTVSNHYFQLSEVLGQACRESIPDSVGVDLLPPSIASKLDFKRRKPFLAAAALCLPLAPLMMLVGALGGSDYERATKQIKRQIPDYEERFEQIEKNQAEAKSVHERIHKLQMLVNSKSNWGNFFADLQDRLQKVQDVWLDSLEVVRLPEGMNTFDPRELEKLGDDLEGIDINYRLKISGRMLLRAEGSNSVGLDPRVASQRVKGFIRSITELDFIEGVVGEPEFPPEESTDRILKFYFTLKVNPERPL